MHNHHQHHQHLDLPSPVFFKIDDLEKGKTLLLAFPKIDPLTSPPLLTREQAESIPLSSKSLPFLLKLFSAQEGSRLARAIKEGIKGCEDDAIKGTQGQFGSYGSTLRYKSVERVKPIGKHSLLGASGQLAKLGLAPFLWCTILLLLVTYIHSVVIASNLPRVTARFGLLAWLGVFLATSGLVMFYRRSRKNPGYIMMNESDLQNIKDDIETNNPAFLAGNWSQLCATCKAASSVTNNGKLSGRSMDYDGENSDDPHADEQHFNEEVQTDYGQENVGEVDDLSQDEAAAEASWEKEGKSENPQYSSKQDSLVESVLTLQSVQRALQSG